jgi:hypothetical protein
VFGLDASALQPLAGKSGSSGDAGSQVLRAGPRARMDSEVAAATAAAHVVPVPPRQWPVEVGDDIAVLLENCPASLPGQAAADLAGSDQPGPTRPVELAVPCTPCSLELLLQPTSRRDGRPQPSTRLPGAAEVTPAALASFIPWR